MSVSNWRRAKERELARIYRENPDAATVRREYRIADAKFREAVAEGNGTPESGALITERVAVRDAWVLYAIEKGIVLEGSK